MRNPALPRPTNADLGSRVELRPAPAATPGNVVPALARLLRRLRDRERGRRKDTPPGKT